MKLNLDNARIRELIPNIIHEVEGETPLYDKLRPWLESARLWLEKNIIGTDYQPEGELLSMAERIIVNRSFADAVPSLDVTLSPAGFAVINTDGRAPASKERIERLIASLRESVDTDLEAYILLLLKNADWRSTTMGDYWLGTFMHGLDEAQARKKDRDLLTTYRLLRESALRFQDALVGNYIGKNVIFKVRSSIYEGADGDEDSRVLWRMLCSSTRRYIRFVEPNLNAADYHNLSHHIWHLAQPILDQLRTCDDLYPIWQEEMGDKIKVQPFKNTVKGGYFF